MSGFNPRILKEIKLACLNKEFDFFMDEGKYVQLEPNNCYLRWNVKHGIYAGQTHILRIKFIYGSNELKVYPKSPPNVVFLTPIWHTNINKNGGSICVDVLRDDPNDKQAWSPIYGIESIFQSILVLLNEHNTSSPYNSEASKEYTEAIKAAMLTRFGREPTKAEMQECAGTIVPNEIQSFVDKANRYYQNNLGLLDSVVSRLLVAPEFDSDEKKEK
jgi:ubiquitin-protein ligase